MTTSTSAEVTAFIAQLPPERRRDVQRVRDVIRKNLPAGYEEVVVKGMLVYHVPFKRYSDTYNGQPLWYVALASQKAYLSLHLMSVYADKVGAERLKEGFRAAGKKLDMGKACVRFKKADDLPLDLIGSVIAAIPVDRWIAIAEAAFRR